MKKARTNRRKLHPDTVTLIKQIALGVLAISIIALIVTAVWYGTRLESVTITEVSVGGGETIEHERLYNEIDAQLKGTYLRLIPRRFAYLYPREDIVAAIAGIPRIKDLSLRRHGGKKLHLEVTEYEPAALWCEGETRCLLLDSTTYAFAEAPELSGDTFVRYQTIGASPSLGLSIVTSSEYITLQQIVTALKEHGWRVTKISVDAARDAFLELSAGSEIVIALGENGEVMADNLKVVLSSDDFKGLELGEFQYIDLRFGNKVFVNRSDEAAFASSTDERLVDFSISPELPVEQPEATVTTTSTSSTEVLE